MAICDTQKLLEERAKTHGSYASHSRITQYLKDVMDDADRYKNLKPEHREALDMIAHKIGRILAGDPNFKDHWNDIAGYSTLASEACDKK